MLDGLANHPPLLEGMYTLLDRTMRRGEVDRELEELAGVGAFVATNTDVDAPLIHPSDREMPYEGSE